MSNQAPKAIEPECNCIFKNDPYKAPEQHARTCPIYWTAFPASASRIASAPPKVTEETHSPFTGEPWLNPFAGDGSENEAVRSVEACDQPNTGIPTLLEWLIERQANCLRIAENKAGDDLRGWLEDANYFGQAVAIIEQNIVRSQSHPSLQESENISTERLQQMVQTGEMWCGSPEVPSMARELLELRSKSPEPPAGPAFEVTEAMVDAGMETVWYRDGIVQRDSMRKLLQRALQACAPIDLNATREEGWKDDFPRWVEFVERFEDMSREGKVRIQRQQDGDVILTVVGRDAIGVQSFSSVEFCAPMSGGGKSEKTWIALMRLAEAMEDDNKDKPQDRSAFVQGIGGKP